MKETPFPLIVRAIRTPRACLVGVLGELRNAMRSAAWS